MSKSNRVTAPGAIEPFLDGCEPEPTPETKFEESSQDLGWCIVTKTKAYEFNKDTDCFEPTTALPKIQVRLRMDHRILFDMPFVGHLTLDQVAENLTHCEERLAWYRGYKKELQEQLESLTLGATKVCGAEWVSVKQATTSTTLRRRNDHDEPEGTVL